MSKAIKWITAALIGWLFSAACQAQQLPQNLLPLWAGGPPDCVEAIETELVQDNRIGRRLAKVKIPGLEVHLPPDSIATGTGVIICPGGGYTILAWDWEGTDIANWYNQQGIAAFILQYRLPHWMSSECRSTVALADAQRAIRLVRSKASEYKIDPAKIGIMGFSAGGHLASTAGTHFDKGIKDSKDAVDRVSCRPDFMVLMYPVVTMDTTFAHRGSRTNLIGENPSKESEIYYSNEKQITPETPPTILIHADDDKSVVPENSVNFYLNLRKNGVPAAMHIFTTGGHGFSLAKGKGPAEIWPQLVLDWLKEQGF
ncbi:MAG: alpha/beta hydrolase [Bacteroidia bacterium]